ncbi:MAG: C25 family cysteine peptidase [Chloroflexi bacterium]|nr:C25 family cysteine peptidase [Chloroflexota bacterium]
MKRTLLLSLAVLASLVIQPVSAMTPGENSSPASVRLVEILPDGMILEIEAPSLRVKRDGMAEGGYDRIQMPGAANQALPGEPQTPRLGALIGIPAQASVEVRVIAEELRPVAGRYRLAPEPTPVPLEEELTPGVQELRPDAAAYARDAFLPALPARLAETGWMRDQRIARLEFAPVLYNAAQGRLLWRKWMRVEVRFRGEGIGDGGEGIGEWGKASAFEGTFEGALLNYEQAKAWRGAPSGAASAAERLASLPQAASGPRYKIVVEQDGLYRLTYADLLAAGMDVDVVDPLAFHMTSQGYDVSIYVSGEEDASFDPGDEITFYGERFKGERMAALYPDENTHWFVYSQQLPNGSYTFWKPQFNAEMMEKYTRENVYWLTHDETPGAQPRMATVDGAPHDTAPVPETYTATVHAEEQKYWYTFHFTSEDTWFLDSVAATNQRTYAANLTALATTPFSATLRGELVARIHDEVENPDHHTKVWINNTNNLVDDATWSGRSRYRFDQQIPQTYLQEGANQVLFRIYFDAYLGQEGDWLYFDWFEIEYARRFQAENDQLLFSRDQITTTWQYTLSGFTSPAVELFEVSDALNPARVLNARQAGGALAFESAQAGAATFFAAGSQAALSPKSISFYNPPDLKAGANAAEYLLITHRDLVTATQALADYRAAQGITTRVIDVADLYNEFNEGIYHPIAIKNFLAYALANWAQPPGYVVLVGDGHFNLQGSTIYNSPPIYLPPNLSWVDPGQQGEVDSANLLAAVVGSDPLPDLHIARMPVNDATEMSNILSKISAYEAAPVQDWQKRLLFLSDDVPDPKAAGEFYTLTTSLIAEYIAPGWSGDHIPLDDYTDTGLCNPTSIGDCVPAIDDINAHLNSPGALVMNYIGHASVDYWAAPRMYTRTAIPALANGDSLPVMLSMTCLDGFWDYPGAVSTGPLPSLAEEMLRAADKGAIATFSPTGLGVSTGHDELNRGFFDALFVDGQWQLAQAVQSAQLRLYASGSDYDLLHTFVLFGDPLLRLREPYLQPALDPVNQADIGAPGRTVTYTLQITNTSSMTDSFNLSAPGGWLATPPDQVGPLGPGDAASFDVTVLVNSQAADGQVDVTQVIATSAGDASESTLVWLTTTARHYGVQVNPTADGAIVPQGTTHIYAIEVTNSGAFVDQFAVMVSGNQWPTVPATTTVGPLNPGQKATLNVQVTPPAGAVTGAQDSALVSAVSLSEGSAQAEAALTTTAGHAYQLSLTPALDQRTAAPNAIVGFSLVLTNLGVLDDTYDITVSGNAWPGVTWQPHSAGPLSTGEQGHILVSVLTPVNAEEGDLDTMTVTVTSRGDGSVIAEAELEVTIQIDSYSIYLPQIVRGDG